MPKKNCRSYAVQIHELAPGPNGTKGLIRMHWTQYMKLLKRWTMDLRSQRPGSFDPIQHCDITITRYHTGHGIRDIDNLYASCKVPLDALQHAGWIEEDDVDHIHELRVRQVRVGKREEQKTLIHIQEVDHVGGA